MRRFEAQIKGQPSLRRASGRSYYRRRGDRSSSQVACEQTRHGVSVNDICPVHILTSVGFCHRCTRMAKIKSSTDSPSGQPLRSRPRSYPNTLGELGLMISRAVQTASSISPFDRDSSWSFRLLSPFSPHHVCQRLCSTTRLA